MMIQGEKKTESSPQHISFRPSFVPPIVWSWKLYFTFPCVLKSSRVQAVYRIWSFRQHVISPKRAFTSDIYWSEAFCTVCIRLEDINPQREDVEDVGSQYALQWLFLFPPLCYRNVDKLPSTCHCLIAFSIMLCRFYHIEAGVWKISRTKGGNHIHELQLSLRFNLK